MSKKKTKHLLVLRSACQEKTLVIDKSKGVYTWADSAREGVAFVDTGYSSVLDHIANNWIANPTQGGFVRVIMG